MTERLFSDDRAVSVAITHVLVIGITTILISGLLIGTGTLLESQQDRATFDEKTTIGDRLATELTEVSKAAEREPEDDIIVRTEQPRQLSGGQYQITLYNEDSGECTTWDPDQCLVLESGQTDDDIEVPVHDPDGIDIDEEARVQGGEIWIYYDSEDGELTIRQERA